MPLADLLLDEPKPRVPRRWSIVVVRSANGMAALGVDRIVGVSSIVRRLLPEPATVAHFVTGAWIAPDGKVGWVLDPQGLVAEAGRARARPAAAAVSRLPILVIDDSLTTRMLERSILESAGYEVELATSAEEGLEKARAGRYALFLVDVEMPGMDGFEFIARTRADPQLREVPAILVTSRDSPDDLRRGKEVGAHAHVAKGNFDQGELLHRIEELIA